VTASLFLHHFDAEELPASSRTPPAGPRAGRQRLHRAQVPYLFDGWLPFSSAAGQRRDGLVSIRRGFRADELRAAFDRRASPGSRSAAVSLRLLAVAARAGSRDPERRDVVVVAAGGGSALAALLARRGHDVLLLDAARFPGTRSAARASPRGVGLLERTGAADAVRPLAPPPARHAARVPGRTAFRGSTASRAGGLAVRRLDLDAVLLAAAGAAGPEVRQGCRVVRLVARRGRGGLAAEAGSESTSSGPVRAGRRPRSVVARSLASSATPLDAAFRVRGHWDGVAALEDFGEMHVAAGAYCGVAPLGPTLANSPSSSTGGTGTGGRRPRGLLPAQPEERWPALAERLEGARSLSRRGRSGPSPSSARRRRAGGAAAGDAAGFYDRSPARG